MHNLHYSASVILSFVIEIYSGGAVISSTFVLSGSSQCSFEFKR